MRVSPLLVLVLLLLPTAPASPPAAEQAPHVDAGVSVRAAVGALFALEGTLEGFGAGVAVEWVGPSGCAIDAPSLVLVTVSCDNPGVHVFTLTAVEGASVASDAVAVVVTREERVPLVAQQGHTVLGLPDEEGGTTTGLIDGATVRVSFSVPEGATRLDASLAWSADGSPAEGLDAFALRLVKGATNHDSQGGAVSPQEVAVQKPGPGPWRAEVRPETALDASWELRVDATRLEGDAPLPDIEVPTAPLAPGEAYTLEALLAGGTAPYAVAWETDPTSRRFDDGQGTTFEGVFTAPTVVRAKVTDARGFEAVATAQLRDVEAAPARPLTVVAVIDNAFSPYHYDFLGHQHPWNRDADPANDHDFYADPASYVAGHPGATPLSLTLPSSEGEDVNALRNADAEVWSQFPSSSLASGANLVWFPGTKIVAAARFGATFQSTNGAHGTASASVAAGNWHGSCPECVFVLVAGMTPEALRWAATQPWIDVVTNSYGHSLVGLVRDNIYLSSPVEATRAASEAGQVIVFSAGNGLLNAFDVPMFTYWSSEKGPDWIVTVGAATPTSEQTYSGAGKPVDITSIGVSYPASGGSSANGTGTHSGTSNAAPVTAGYFAKVIQQAREALGDVTPGHAGGVVAEGAPVACGEANASCALGDGVLTRRELADLVFHNVLPSPMRVVVGIPPPWPTTPLAYHYQGHGVLSGLSQGQAEHDREWMRMVDAAHGRVLPYERPSGERGWFVADSACRQKAWGSWGGGYYTGGTPTFDPATEHAGMALFTACDGAPEGVLT